ncbi:MAG: hypothetical protein QOF87_2126 [Pseudonocardiales bacterium]|nr:hypothetical protein [Pseudonocardiales bacterium]
MNARTVPLRTDDKLNRTRVGVAAGLAALACTVTAALLALPPAAGAAEAPVDMGLATSYAVVGGQTVTNTGPSVIHGDLGVSPGSAAPGFGGPPSGLVINGTIHTADAEAAGAQSAAGIAYRDISTRAKTADVGPELGGQTLPSGVYDGGTLKLTGALTLNGNSAAVFIFRAASTLITAPGSSVKFIGGANACNVFWQIGSSATLDTTTAFAGTVLASASISAKTGATVVGRLLASTGAVTLDDNVITRPFCSQTLPSSPASSATTSTGTGGGGTGTGTGTATGTGTGTGTGAAPGGPPGSATARGVVPSASSTATTPVGVAVPRVATPSTARTTSQIALTSQRVHLAQTGLPLVLMQLLGWAIVLAVVGAGLILGSGRFRAKYSGRH